MTTQVKQPKLIVVIAFDRGADGELFPAFGPEDQQSESAGRKARRRDCLEQRG